MNYRGIEFCFEQAPEREDVWIWRFNVDGEGPDGKALTKRRLLAMRSMPHESGIGGESLKAKF